MIDITLLALQASITNVTDSEAKLKNARAELASTHSH